MKIVAWVPIKMNNERLPGKNILPLAGKPLCQHVLGELLKLDEIDGVYAFCSEQELENYIQKEVTRIPRSETLNSFSTKINDVILAFSNVIDADVYVYAQVTSPFLKKETIERGLNAVLSGEYDSALSVKVLHDFLWKDEKPFNYNPVDIARTQDLEILYQETGGFYIYTKDLIQNYNRRTGFKPYFTEVSEMEAVDIDYREDYELAQSIVLKDYGRTNDAYNISRFRKWVRIAENGGNISDYFEVFGYKTCAIYGAGVLGGELYDALKDVVSVKYFIDGKIAEYRDLPCIKPEKLSEMEPIDIIIITPGFDEQKIRHALENSTARIILIDDLLKAEFHFWNREWTQDIKDELKKEFQKEYEHSFNGYGISRKCWEASVNEFLNYMARRANSQKQFSVDTLKSTWSFIRQFILNENVTLPLIDLVITTRCTLRCKKCFHLIPTYAKDGRSPFDVELQTILTDLDKLLSSVDFIVKINILGGEPFLYRHLDELLTRLLAYENVGCFNIVTNGTIIPADSICRFLQNEKFYVFINDYGVSPNISKLEEKLDEFGIMYHTDSDRHWYDFGDLKKKALPESELKENFANCGYAVCKSLMEGELHTCAVHKHGQRNGLIPKSNDALRIHEHSEDELRKKIIEFYNAEYFDVCDYCNAPIRYKSPMIPAGEQEYPLNYTENGEKQEW